MPSKIITTSINPATGEIIGKTPENTVEELRQAIALAKAAQPTWIEFQMSYQRIVVKRKWMHSARKCFLLRWQ